MTDHVIPALSVRSGPTAPRRAAHAFTLVELMVSVTVLVILMLVVANFVSLVQRTWVRTNSHVAQFREARIAFETITRNLSQATLNTYYQNEYETVGQSLTQTITLATKYRRQSELQFVCGPTTGLFGSSATAADYPGHGVFFQAPLGVTSLVTTTGATTANTENMVNLLCGRGYFVEWGDDTSFRPPFLDTVQTVPPRFRLRLMEYSPTAEKNRIYWSTLRPITEHSKQWFDDALTQKVVSADADTAENRAFTRPVAENILALIIAPQLETTGLASGAQPYDIAPNYVYDSTLVTNPGARTAAGASQGTQHLLPPVLKITMIALDHLSGERLSQDTALKTQITSAAGSMFQSASSLNSELGGTADAPGQLDTLLRQNRLNYRVFTSTISMNQSRWSL